jgi:hypothetical protein
MRKKTHFYLCILTLMVMATCQSWAQDSAQRDSDSIAKWHNQMWGQPWPKPQSDIPEWPKQESVIPEPSICSFYAPIPTLDSLHPISLQPLALPYQGEVGYNFKLIVSMHVDMKGRVRQVRANHFLTNAEMLSICYDSLRREAYFKLYNTYVNKCTTAIKQWQFEPIFQPESGKDEYLDALVNLVIYFNSDPGYSALDEQWLYKVITVDRYGSRW